MPMGYMDMDISFSSVRTTTCCFIPLQWASVKDVFKEVTAAEATLYCNANIGNCNLDSK